MVKWRSARLRRLYGKPTDPIENSDDASAGPEPAGQPRPPSDAAPPPPPKRVRREKTRPESEYELVHNLPVTPTPPDYSLLVNPLNEKQANTVAYAIHASRNNWLSGSMFETFWTRKPRGKKAADNQPNLRDKMTKLHECAVTLGPHTFPVKLFTVKDDNVHVDEEQDRKVEEVLAAAEKERQAEEEAKRPNKEAESKDVPNEVKQEEPDSASNEMEANSPEASVPEAKESAVAVSEDGESSQQAVPRAELPKAHGTPDGEDDAPNGSESRRNNDTEAAEVPAAAASTISPSEHEDAESALEHPSQTGSVSEPVAETPVSESDSRNSEPNVAATESAEIEEAAKDPKATKTRRRGRPKAMPAQSVESPGPANTDAVEPLERKKSFEMEKQHLEAEKRRVEELEKQLNGGNAPSQSPETPNGNNEPETPATSAGGVGTNTPIEPEAPVAPNAPVATGAPPASNQIPAQPAPPTVAFAPPRAVPNELVVSKLQQMAARDPNLGELMRVVASQTASHEDIMKFQEIINRVKASIFTLPTPHPKPRAKPKPKAVAPVQRTQTTYQPRAHSKAIMLAIEFDENPTERHLLPKRSIIEYLPAESQLLWSFLHVVDDDNKQTSGAEKRDQKIFTPVTATFHDIPLKVAQTLERCVRKPEIVAYYMKETMASAVRSEPWYLWYRIEKNDEVLLESIKKMQAPTMAPPPPPRKPTKPRKIKAGNNPGDSLPYVHRRRRGEPLVQTHPMIIGRRGQPMVQPPSYYQHIRQRAYGTSVRRPNTIASTPGSVTATPLDPINHGAPMWTANASGPQFSQAPQISGSAALPAMMSPQESVQPPLNMSDPAHVQSGLPPLPRSVQTDSSEESPARPSHDSVESKMEIDTS